MRFGELTFKEIQEWAQSGSLVVIPTGCTEQQGPHLPVDFDTWFVESVCVAAARRAADKYDLKVLVLPALPFGPTAEHRNYGGGYIHIPQELHDALVDCVLHSLAEQGFQRIVVWRGCGGHDLGRVLKRFNAAHAGQVQVFQPELPYHEIWCRVGDPTLAGGHADSFATSIALHLRPDSVRVERIPPPGEAAVDWGDPNLDFSRYSSSGVIGDATLATAELGARLWEAIVETVAQVLQRISNEDAPNGV